MSEKRLTLDDACAPEGFWRMDVSDNSSTRSCYNLPDGLTKSIKLAGLLLVMRKSTLSNKVDQ